MLSYHETSLTVIHCILTGNKRAFKVGARHHLWEPKFSHPRPVRLAVSGVTGQMAPSLTSPCSASNHSTLPHLPHVPLSPVELFDTLFKPGPSHAEFVSHREFCPLNKMHKHLVGAKCVTPYTWGNINKSAQRRYFLTGSIVKK